MEPVPDIHPIEHEFLEIGADQPVERISDHRNPEKARVMQDRLRLLKGQIAQL